MTDTKDAPSQSSDDHYFTSYAHIAIHEDMLKDESRTCTYLDAVEQCAELIAGKVVIDVGCGTGVLSIFCARAGARKVYAVDASAIADQARAVVEHNGLSHVIQVMRGKIEEVDIPEKADVIISEWMGYVLVYESMLDSVIFARDKYLKPGGIMLPTSATIYAGLYSDEERFESSLEFWRDVYEIDMSPIIPLARKCATSEPLVEDLSSMQIISWPAKLWEIDLATVTVEDIASFSPSFSLVSMVVAPLHGLAIWFDVTFPTPNRVVSGAPGTQASGSSTAASSSKQSQSQPLVLSTSPDAEPTHWGQTLLLLDEPPCLTQDEVVHGTLTFSRNKENPRFLDLCLACRTKSASISKSFSLK
eukprot:jgi/Mesvir1/5479/Mv15529-RA.1